MRQLNLFAGCGVVGRPTLVLSTGSARVWTRRLAAAALAVVVVLATAGCRRRPPQVETVEDENQGALSVIHVAHPRATPQLLSGFHQVEQNSWRWTSSRFAVLLGAPAGASQNGARLEVRLSVPESVLARRKTITLSCAVEGTPLAPETFVREGEATYTRDVPAPALARPPVKVTFAVDHFLKAGEVETRELGIIVSSVGLLEK